MTPEQQKRILIVDDDPNVRELLGSVLRRRSLVVDEAADGAQALDLARENQYAVVLLDLIMPVLDGFAVLEQFSGPAMTWTPVVLVMTGADRSIVAQLDAQRIHGVVRKPFDAEELAQLVVACAEIKSRNPFGAMAIATMIAGGPLLALLNGLP